MERAGVVGRREDFTRNCSYTALSRAREPTELFILDTPTKRELDRTEIAPGQTRGLRDERTPIERLDAAMRCRDDEDLALDRFDAEGTRGPAHVEPARMGRERRVLRERAAELNAQLSTRRREHLRVALEPPAPYLTEVLSALPDQPRARRTWQQAAARIEAYRFDHATTDTRDPLGSRPSDRRERAHWQRAHHDLQRAQRDLGHRIERQYSH